MTWSLDIKGFHSSGKNFTAIVPVYSGYARQYNCRAVNHVQISGVAIAKSELAEHELAEWHPDNPFANSKWIEVDLHLCKWKPRTNEILERRAVGKLAPDSYYHTSFFVPASELMPLHWTTEVIYRSSEREREEVAYYQASWQEFQAQAIANSYY